MSFESVEPSMPVHPSRPLQPVRTSPSRRASVGALPAQPAPKPPRAPSRCEDWLAVVQGVRAGDPAALAKLSGLVTGLLYRQGAYRLGDAWDDLCQEVLAALVRSVERGSLREPRAFVSFASTLTRNYLLDHLRSRRRVTAVGHLDPANLRESSDLLEELPLVGHCPDLLLDLERSLGALSPRGRRVIEEIYLRGRTYQEVADRFSIPLGTVKRLQTRGLRQLRKILLEGDSAGG